ncbi:MAG TPA: glycosyltransferase [Candidatus Limnocylindrales bacterium]|nr:glycosyltransferase [Candidatus Limnocylindrales bacterium]
MNGTLRGRRPEPGRLVADAAAAVRELEGLGHRDPILVAYHPIARMNPYQALLYAGAWRQGVASVPLFDLEELDHLVALRDATGARLVLHLHWTNRILEGAADPVDARARLDMFVARLDRFVAAGGAIAWTVHNVLPHGAAMPALEAALQQAIVDRATVVHVMSSNAAAEVAEWFTIPADKLLHVPHPNYIGAYVDSISREAARWELDLPVDDTVYALLGAIKPYKGLDQLLGAFAEISAREGGRRRLVVAGMPSNEPGVDDFLERCELDPFISLYPRSIPGDDMQVFLRAADIAVLPYLRSLNSGVLMLALSFGVPVVAPRVGGIAEIVGPEVGRLYDPLEPNGLIAAMLAADELRTPQARDAARRAAERYDPARLSSEFARGIADRLATPVGSVGETSVPAGGA